MAPERTTSQGPVETGKSKIFLSYSTQPPENADFVRTLAGWLRRAGFEVWLDEEQMWPGAHIQKEIKRAVESSGVGVFVVTSRWLEREWTQFEVALFGRQESSRRLVLLREETDLGELGPHLASFKTVRWFPEEADPPSRFWELYCGIVALPPGPRETWSAKGGDLMEGGHPSSKTGTTKPPAPPKRSPPPPSGRIALPCSGRPEATVTSEAWTYIVTDLNEWIGLSATNELLSPIERLSLYAAALATMEQELVVALFEPAIARLRNSVWEHAPHEAPILSLCATPDGMLTGSAAGVIAPLEKSATTRPLRLRDPVMALTLNGGRIMAIGSRGSFGRLRYPWDEDEEFDWIETRDLGRPIGFFQAFEVNCAGVFSARKMALIDPETRQLTILNEAFEEGIRQVIFLGAQAWPYAVLTDAGHLYMVNAGLTSRRPVQMPSGVLVCGCAPSGSARFAPVWTTRGHLFGLRGDGSVELLADDHVVLASVPEAADGILNILRWEKGAHATLEARSFR